MNLFLLQKITNKMNKRQTKKVDKNIKNKGKRCPECNSKNGMYGVVVDENKIQGTIFLYCKKCGYEYEESK